MSDVTIVRLAGPSYIASVRRHTTFARLPSEIRGYYDVIYAAIRSGKIAKGGHNVAIYRNASRRGVDVECGVQVAAPFAAVGEIECREMPTGEAATTVHWGPYDRLGEAHDRVVAWIRANGRELAGVGWELYGDWDDDPTKVRTDVFHLLTPR